MIKINLIKEEGDDKIRSLVYFGFYALNMMAIFVGGILYVNHQWSEISVLERQNKRLEKQVEKLEEKTEEIDKIEEIKAALRQKLLLIAKLKKSKSGPVRVLNQINLSIPAQSWLTSIKEGDRSLAHIKGTSLDDQSVALFASNLSGSQFFRDVKISEMVQDTLDDSLSVKRFDIEAVIRYEGALADQIEKAQQELESKRNSKKGKKKKKKKKKKKR